jgi:hypothetical protein
MALTYEPIATTTLASAQSSITFSSIPATYTDLRLVLVSFYDTGGSQVLVRVNSNSATNYSHTTLYGNGTSPFSTNQTNQTYFYPTGSQGGGSSATLTLPTLTIIDMFSYAGSTNKTFLANTSQDKNGSGVTITTCGLWRSTAAITSIQLTVNSAGSYNTGTTATLYGIKAA